MIAGDLLIRVLPKEAGRQPRRRQHVRVLVQQSPVDRRGT
jgi:hypothetical protein